MTITREEIRRNALRLGSAGASKEKIRKYVELATADLGSEAPAPIADQAKPRASTPLDVLALPEKKSREGLAMLTDALTPSRADIEAGKVGVPGIAARTAGETLTEVAPGFISPASLGTAGALRGLKAAYPAINAVGRFIGKTAESTSGLGYKTPGVLADVVEDPSILIGKGTQKAGEAYGAVQNKGAIRDAMKAPQKAATFIKQAWKAAQEGGLNPDEALEARKTLDAAKDSFPDIVFRSTRKVFDAIAKQKFGEADKAFSRAVKSEAVRSFWGINRSGTPSIVKGALTTALPASAPFFSPLAQGTIAAGIGAAKKLARPLVRNPSVGFLAGARTPYNEDQ